MTVVMRSLHLLAAAFWIGGALVYATALLPSMNSYTTTLFDFNNAYRSGAKVAVWALTLTGAFMVVDRLTDTPGLAYVLVLSAKVALALMMFYSARTLVRRTARRRLERTGRSAGGDELIEAGKLQDPHRTPFFILALGVVVFVLGAVLNVISRNGTGW